MPGPVQGPGDAAGHNADKAPGSLQPVGETNDNTPRNEQFPKAVDAVMGIKWGDGAKGPRADVLSPWDLGRLGLQAGVCG